MFHFLEFRIVVTFFAKKPKTNEIRGAATRRKSARARIRAPIEAEEERKKKDERGKWIETERQITGNQSSAAKTNEGWRELRFRCTDLPRGRAAYWTCLRRGRGRAARGERTMSYEREERSSVNEAKEGESVGEDTKVRSGSIERPGFLGKCSREVVKMRSLGEKIGRDDVIIEEIDCNVCR